MARKIITSILLLISICSFGQGNFFFNQHQQIESYCPYDTASFHTDVFLYSYITTINCGTIDADDLQSTKDILDSIRSDLHCNITSFGGTIFMTKNGINLNDSLLYVKQFTSFDPDCNLYISDSWYFYSFDTNFNNGTNDTIIHTNNGIIDYIELY